MGAGGAASELPAPAALGTPAAGSGAGGAARRCKGGAAAGMSPEEARVRAIAEVSLCCGDFGRDGFCPLAQPFRRFLYHLRKWRRREWDQCDMKCQECEGKRGLPVVSSRHRFVPGASTLIAAACLSVIACFSGWGDRGLQRFESCWTASGK